MNTYRIKLIITMAIEIIVPTTVLTVDPLEVLIKSNCF